MVAASSIEGGLKMTSEGMSSSAGGQFGSGTLGGTGMVSNLVLNSTEIKPPYCLLVQKSSLSEAVAKQFRTAYDDYREKIAVQTARDGIPRRVARVDELMALNHRRTRQLVQRAWEFHPERSEPQSSLCNHHTLS